MYMNCKYQNIATLSGEIPGKEEHDTHGICPYRPKTDLKQTSDKPRTRAQVYISYIMCVNIQKFFLKASRCSFCISIWKMDIINYITPIIYLIKHKVLWL
jgi:hypothetical protein